MTDLNWLLDETCIPLWEAYQATGLVQRNSSPLSSDGIIRIAAIQPWATKRPWNLKNSIQQSL